MTNTSYTIRVTRALRLFAAFLMLIGSVALAQDRTPHPQSFQGTPFRDIAAGFYSNTDLVAVGRFGPPVEVGDDLLSLLRNREIDMPFTVQIVYKGNVRPGSVVQIRLQSDMLAFPGERISRYEKRRQVIEAKREELHLAASEAAIIDEEHARGEITASERQLRLQEMDARYRDSGLMREIEDLRGIDRAVNVLHVETFYEREGAILPDTDYLVAVHAIDGNPYYYLLDDRLSWGIMWGEIAADIGSEIESLKSSGSLPIR